MTLLLETRSAAAWPRSRAGTPLWGTRGARGGGAGPSAATAQQREATHHHMRPGQGEGLGADERRNHVEQQHERHEEGGRQQQHRAAGPGRAGGAGTGRTAGGARRSRAAARSRRGAGGRRGGAAAEGKRRSRMRARPQGAGLPGAGRPRARSGWESGVPGPRTGLFPHRPPEPPGRRRVVPRRHLQPLWQAPRAGRGRCLGPRGAGFQPCPAARGAPGLRVRPVAARPPKLSGAFGGAAIAGAGAPTLRQGGGPGSGSEIPGSGNGHGLASLFRTPGKPYVEF